ncbi:hypothetical protein DsansV1_C13g0116501 [Dioscorea sansibarensis]
MNGTGSTRAETLLLHSCQVSADSHARIACVKMPGRACTDGCPGWNLTNL